ncbi:hypothetical protein P691DRAFT_38207 [Macrolepiota fuliginosa MF-IS2]|uniref:Uncharacterized protein n=1 Tax=Macrolepiota fuliginosa MF-IS2 TaxID=1400762 RepID=A0A9P5XCQ1_9AGAR|nr:hypothetical protein P691DRAFT_38207 [Macrolepiota fuliginosa MF-IS2]
MVGAGGGAASAVDAEGVVWSPADGGLELAGGVIDGVVVEGATGNLGRLHVPSKWPQRPFISTSVVNLSENMAQFIPNSSSFGTDADRTLFARVIIFVSLATGGAHNLKEYRYSVTREYDENCILYLKEYRYYDKVSIQKADER